MFYAFYNKIERTQSWSCSFVALLACHLNAKRVFAKSENAINGTPLHNVCLLGFRFIFVVSNRFDTVASFNRAIINGKSLFGKFLQQIGAQPEYIS